MSFLCSDSTKSAIIMLYVTGTHCFDSHCSLVANTQCAAPSVVHCWRVKVSLTVSSSLQVTHHGAKVGL